MIRFNNIDFSYGATKVLSRFNFSMNKKEFVILSGGNGSGKSTFLRLLLNSLKPDSGEIERDIENIGYVAQQGSERNYNFPITVKEMVRLGVYDQGKYKDDKVNRALVQVKMLDKKNQLFSSLSGGQKQRVLIAKALASEPELLIMDEPFTGLDDKSRKSLVFLLNHFHKDHGLSLLIVTHELEEFSKAADTIYFLEKGQLKNV